MNIPRKNELPRTCESGARVRSLGSHITVPRPDVDDRVTDGKVQEVCCDFWPLVFRLFQIVVLVVGIPAERVIIADNRANFLRCESHPMSTHPKDIRDTLADTLCGGICKL